MAENHFLVPVVGMYHRPPALQVILELPIGTKLLLMREPTNQYDPNAIKVFLPGFSPIGDHAHIYDRYSYKAEENIVGDLLHLGYVSSKTGEAGILSAEFDKRGMSLWEAALISQKGNLVVAMLKLDSNPEGLRCVRFSATDRKRLSTIGVA